MAEAHFDWEGLELYVGAASLNVLAGGHPVASLEVVVPLPPATTEVLADEVESSWDALTVRWNVDRTVSLRVRWSGAAPRLRVEGDLPPRILAAGVLAWVAWQLPDGRVLLAEQLAGEASADGAELTLGPTDGLATWRLEVVADASAVAGRLPSWWVPLVVDADSEWGVDLPDAAVVVPTGVEQVTSDPLSVRIRRGVTPITIHQGRGTTRLEVAGAPRALDLADEWLPELSARDPRSLTGAELVCLQTAAATRGRVLDLAAACEEGLRRPDALGVLAAVRQLAQQPDAVLAEALADAVTRLPAQPGALLAAVHTAAALGTPVVEPTPTPLTGVHARVAAEERRVLAGGSPDALVWLLGAGLPGRTPVPADVVAVAAALVAWLPEAASPRGLPGSLGEVADACRRWLLAHHPEPDVVAWLLLP